MPRWQSNFNKNSVMAKLVSEIAVPPVVPLPGSTTKLQAKLIIFYM